MYKLKSGIQVACALGLPVVMAESANKEKLTSKKESNNENSSGAGRFVKASQLPIYESIEDFYSYEYHGKEKGMLQDGISAVRKELGSALEITNEVRDNVNHFYMTGKAHTLSSIDYLREDENVAARVGAIAAGGLLGLIFAFRRGFFKKLIYTSAGAGGTASICYPKEAFELSQDVVYNAGDYAAIGYNFLVGVKPQSKDDFSEKKLQEKKLPMPTKVPKSIDSAATTKIPEVRKPYSLDFLAQQASDITVWGFRLKHYDHENETEIANPKLVNSSMELQKEVIQASSFNEVEVISKDALELIAAEAANEEAKKINSVLHKISEMTEKVENFSEKVEKVSSVINKSAEFAEKEVKVFTNHPCIEKVAKEVEIFSNKVSSIASEVDKAAKFINSVDDSLIKVDKNIGTLTEKVIANKKDKIVEEIKEIIEKKVNDEQKRSFISQIFSVFQSKDKSQLEEDSEKLTFSSNSDQLLSDSSDKHSNPINKLCDNDQLSANTHDSSSLSTSEADSDNLLNMPIVVIPESQILSTNEKSDYENRMDQIEMLEDVFINAMLRMQKQENDAQSKNISENTKKSNMDGETSSSNQTPSVEHKINIESFISESTTMDVNAVKLNNLSSAVHNEPFVVNSMDKADTDCENYIIKSEANILNHSDMKIVETDDLRFVESSGRILKIPDVIDTYHYPEKQMTTKTKKEDKNENKKNEDEKTKKDKAAKDVILKLEKPLKNKIEGDIGQSNPEDKDMYTTRG